MPADVVHDITPHEVTPLAWQRGSGHLAVRGVAGHVGPVKQQNALGSELYKRGGCGSALELHSWMGRRPKGKPRSEPDSGNPTVRDRRGACGNVAMGMAIRARKAETPKQPSCCLRLRALHFYPDHLESIRQSRVRDLTPSARIYARARVG